MGGRISDVGSPRPREVKKDRQDKAEEEEEEEVEVAHVLVMVVVGFQRNCTARCRRGL